MALACAAYAQAQAPGAASQERPSPVAATVQSLRVVPLAGNGEMNEMSRGVMAPLVVQVLDVNSRPVEGVDVFFRFPLTGPSAAFADGRNSAAVRTNADGQAAASSWKANGQAGKFGVRITAVRGNEMGETTITMTNVDRIVEEMKPKRKSWWTSRWLKIGIVAAGATTAAILLTRGNGSGPTVTISTGPPTIGGPR